MKFYLCIFCFSVILLGCGTTHTVKKSAVNAVVESPVIAHNPLIQLQKDINSILADSLFIPARASIKVATLNDGKVLYERDSKALMHPASNIKLLISAAALSLLDTNFQFKTSVFIDEISIDGKIAGNIYLKGYGDPDLTTSDLDSLAYAISKMGITDIVGNLIVDDSFFDDEYWGAGWTWDDESDPDAPYINALSVNKNCIRTNISTDSNNVLLSIEPTTDFVTVINKASIAVDSIRVPLNIKRLYLNNPNTIVVEGELFPFCNVAQKFSLRRPEFYTGTLFKESLQHSGISFNGEIVSGAVPDGLHEIAQHLHPIEQVITNMNKTSDNLSAENVLKVIGAVKNNVPGSAKNGLVFVKQFISKLGIDTTKISIADGSGVSRYNLLSADQLVQFLIEMYKQPKIFPMFYHSLPIAGVDGTLSKRMYTYPAACNLRAKTGTLNGVSCLSGYVQTRDGEMLVFSIMMQNFITSAANYRQVQDKICTLLAGFSRKNIVN